MRLTHTAAQHLMLAAQGLDRPATTPATKEHVLATIRRMAALQIDTISVVARSPYLVLWSRLGDYEPVWLDEWLAEGALFEYWAHAACFIPIEDWPIYRRLMLEGVRGWTNAAQWLADNREVAEMVLAHIRAKGAARSSDFDRMGHQSTGWWDWKPAKMALEAYHNTGDLMITARRNFQRVYDLRERVLPDWNDRQAPTREVAERFLVLKAIRSLGITKARWVGPNFKMSILATTRMVKSLAAAGMIMTAEVEGWDSPAYIHPDNLALAEDAREGRLTPTLTTLLSPFDPLVRDRGRAREMFSFDYLIECYTPAPKRRYGYFTLPILRRGALIGRLDPKAHRKEGLFEVKALHLEPGVEVTDEVLTDLRDVLLRCAAWHKTPQVVIRQSDPPELADCLNADLITVDRA